MAEIRDKYDYLTTEEKIETFITLCEKTSCKSSKAYLAVATMRKAEHTNWPNKQFHYFRQGKEMLENYIRENPGDLEARYLRIMVQLNVPSYIDYKDDYKTDYVFLKKEIGSSALPQSYQTRILSKIKNKLKE